MDANATDSEAKDRPVLEQKKPYQDLTRVLRGLNPCGAKRKCPDGSVDPRPQRIDSRFCGTAGESGKRAVIPMREFRIQAADARFCARAFLT